MPRCLPWLAPNGKKHTWQKKKAQAPTHKQNCSNHQSTAAQLTMFDCVRCATAATWWASKDFTTDRSSACIINILIVTHITTCHACSIRACLHACKLCVAVCHIFIRYKHNNVQCVHTTFAKQRSTLRFEATSRAVLPGMVRIILTLIDVAIAVLDMIAMA